MANENDGILRNNNNETDDNTSSKKDENSKTTTNNSNNKGDYRNIRATSGDVNHVVEQQPRRDENPFSFKHFLNRDNSGTTVMGSATISNSSSISSTPSISTIIQNSQNLLTTTSTHTISKGSPPIFNSVSEMNSSLYNSYTNNNCSNEKSIESPILPNTLSKTVQITSNLIDNLITTTTTTLAAATSATTTTTSAYQTSTGARPKVPQSASSSSSISGTGINQQIHHHQYPSSSVSTTSMSSLINAESSKMKRSPRFSSFDSQASLAEYAGVNNVSYNVDKILKDAGHALDDNSGVKCGTDTGDIKNENSEIFQGNDYYKMFVPRSYSNYDMDIPVRSTSSYTIGGSGRTANNIENNSNMRRISPARPNRLVGISSQQPHSVNLSKNMQQATATISGNNNSGNVHCRPNSEFAAALPDFVQDHWMDHPWYFNEMHLHSPPNSPGHQQSPPLDFVSDNLPAGMANPPGCGGGGGGGVGVGNPNADKCQTLPDFLSDGPIIHSSGRLADVAVGLPNLDSPEDNSPSLQLSRIRLENDRLRRELDESRIALAEQTRRSVELERRLDLARNNESAFNRTLVQNIGQVEENLDQSKKRAAAAQNQVSKLKQQVCQLTADLDILKRENESLKEEGAVGGTTNIKRPSSNQQLSRDLKMAASNAESNLRQLLTGVENLRLMAASIENTNFDRNHPINVDAAAGISVPSVNLINEEFLSDCDDDFDDFSGPAL